MLTDANGHPKYNSILLETAAMGYQTANNSFISALAPDQWDALHQYSKDYKVYVAWSLSFLCFCGFKFFTKMQL